MDERPVYEIGFGGFDSFTGHCGHGATAARQAHNLETTRFNSGASQPRRTKEGPAVSYAASVRVRVPPSRPQHGRGSSLGRWEARWPHRIGSGRKAGSTPAPALVRLEAVRLSHGWALGSIPSEGTKDARVRRTRGERAGDRTILTRWPLGSSILLPRTVGQYARVERFSLPV